MNTTYSILLAAKASAMAEGDKMTFAGLWDGAAGFAKEIGMPFPAHLREAVLTAGGTLASKTKVTVRGGASRSVTSRNLRDAMTEVVAHAERKGASKEALKELKSELANVVAVTRLLGALGASSYTVEA